MHVQEASSSLKRGWRFAHRGLELRRPLQILARPHVYQLLQKHDVSADNRLDQADSVANVRLMEGIRQQAVHWGRHLGVHDQRRDLPAEQPHQTLCQMRYPSADSTM